MSRARKYHEPMAAIGCQIPEALRASIEAVLPWRFQTMTDVPHWALTRAVEDAEYLRKADEESRKVRRLRDLETLHGETA